MMHRHTAPPKTMGDHAGELERELAESDAVREKLADILSRTAIALKGPEEPLHRHGWDDLPLLAGLAKELAEQALAPCFTLTVAGGPWAAHPAEGCYHYLACSGGEKVDGLELTRCKYCPLREPVAAEGSK